MVHPRYYEIRYAINPYMKDAAGHLLRVDKQLALEQWTSLKKLYESLGFPVEVIEGTHEFPDMVFAANQVFPFRDLKTGKKSVLLSEMKSAQRKGEVPFFETFFQKGGYEVYRFSHPSICCEGNGDLLLHPSRPLIFAGYGHRTDIQAVNEISNRFGYEVLPLRLLSEDFYHLDTCLAVLNAETALVQPEAFDTETFQQLQRQFKTLIPVDRSTNIRDFVCNAHSPNGTDVICHKLTDPLRNQLEDLGFRVHQSPTSEFIKAGGSIFCMKMMIF